MADMNPDNNRDTFQGRGQRIKELEEENEEHRKVYKDPSITTHMIKRNKHIVWRVGRLGILPTGGEYKSELEAMVAALEAAPKESK